jgi:NADP-dependent 3-hydroxy acid dehydrogenase YdfG
MKPSILITGGSKGVGKEIADYFAPRSMSLSRSNGFDIGSVHARKEIVQKSLEYDIFINHAHNGHFEGQTSLLYELFEAWTQAGKSGYIFNTGTIATYLPQKEFKRYAVIKKALEIANQQCCKKIENGLASFRMTLLKPGMLDSENSRKNTQWQGQTLRGQDIAPLIEYLYSTPKNVLINEMVLTGVVQKTGQIDTL